MVGLGAGTIEKVDEDARRAATDGEDRDRFAHIVYVPGKKAAAVVTAARFNGTPVTALCGKKWVPQHDPKRYPVCPTCQEVHRAGRGKDFDGAHS